MIFKPGDKVRLSQEYLAQIEFRKGSYACLLASRTTYTVTECYPTEDSNEYLISPEDPVLYKRIVKENDIELA